MVKSKELNSYPQYRIYEDGRLECTTKYINRFPGFRAGTVNASGYICYSLGAGSRKIMVYAHRLVALAFIPKIPDKPLVLHRDGNPKNNKVTNLYWGDDRDNHKDMIKHGTTTKGVQNYHAKLTNEQVLEIWKKSKNISGVFLAKEYNVSRATISRIKNKTHWKSLLPQK